MITLHSKWPAIARSAVLPSWPNAGKESGRVRSPCSWIRSSPWCSLYISVCRHYWSCRTEVLSCVHVLSAIDGRVGVNKSGCTFRPCCQDDPNMLMVRTNRSSADFMKTPTIYMNRVMLTATSLSNGCTIRACDRRKLHQLFLLRRCRSSVTVLLRCYTRAFKELSRTPAIVAHS